MLLEAPSERTASDEVTQITSNTCNEPIIDRNAHVRIVDPSIGIVTCHWVCHQLAPSIAAASVRSSGMFAKPARKRMRAKPTYFQVKMNSIVQMTTCRL